MVRINPEEFIKRMRSASARKDGEESTEGIILDGRIEGRDDQKSVTLTIIDLRLNRVRRMKVHREWMDIVEKLYRDCLNEGKLPLGWIVYDMNMIERLEVKACVEISKILEIIDAIADKDPRYEFIEIEGRFIDQDTSCAVKMNPAPLILSQRLFSMRALKDILHGKNVQGVVIAHEGARGDMIDAFILKAVEEPEEAEVEGEATSESGGEKEERIELPPEIQRKINELLSQINTSIE